MGFNVAVRRLLQKKFVREQEIHYEDGDADAGLAITDFGWEWVDANEVQFVLTRAERKEEGDIPF